MSETVAFFPLSGPLRRLAKSWWLLLIRGLALVAFGLAAFVSPTFTFLTLVLMFGFYALADGVAGLAAALFGGGLGGRWWLALASLVSIAAGLVALAAPGLGGLSIVAVIGVWCVLRGISEIIGAITLRHEIANEWSLGVGGALSLLFGLGVLAAPWAGATVLLWVVAFWAVITGAVSIAWSFRVRRLAR